MKSLIFVLMSFMVSLSAWAGPDFKVFVDQIREGEIPEAAMGGPSVGDEPAKDDILATAYSMRTLLVKALDESRTLPLGPRIQFFMQRAEMVLQRSYNSPAERFAKLTLQRSRDISNVVIEVAGNNAELVAQWSANFYRTSFELAVSLLNNPKALRTEVGALETSEYIKSVSLAQFGYFYSTLVWRNTANVTSDSAKAVLLLKMVNYLGQDFNSDLRRREPRFKEVIADIYFLQKEDVSYAKVIRALQEGLEPQSADLAALRVKVYKIWTSLASKLNETGLQTVFVER